MKSLIVFLMFTTTVGFSQNIHFNLTELQAYKLPVLNLANPKLADEIARGIEKSQLAELAWIDIKLNEMYLITYKNIKLSDILTLIYNSYNVRFADLEEINFDNDLFLSVYAQKSGILKENIPDKLPDLIYLGDQEKSDRFYETAKEIWVNKYPEKYKILFSTEEKSMEYIPEHYPKYINTGNPDSDNSVFDQAKREWIKQYPEEYKKMSGENYPVKK